MSDDLYHEIYTSEIFESSQCIWHENTLMTFFHSLLIKLGYEPTRSNKKTWRRGDKTVVICLVDDYITVSDDYDIPAPYRFDKNTVVITDNHVTIPTAYPVIQLPKSWFGIYSYTPGLMDFNPTHRINFSVNRLDNKRLLSFLEFTRQTLEYHDRATPDYINFNCWSWDGDNSTNSGRRASFEKAWNQMEEKHRQLYLDAYQSTVTFMPMRNHELSVEQANLSAFVNIVMETYSSDTSIALSEKVFRALVTPAPWIVYAGKHTIAYLESLGFDTMRDIVKHDYDSMSEIKEASTPGDKNTEFIFWAFDNYYRLSNMDQTQLKQRCLRAARHNQELLKTMSQSWPADFAQWLPGVIAKIA